MREDAFPCGELSWPPRELASKSEIYVNQSDRFLRSQLRNVGA
jgi:hypothetical protein